MANVEHYLPFLLKWEGGYSDDPADRGGSTYMGVTLTTYRRLHPEAGAEDLKRMTDSEWAYIVERFYWGRCEANAIRNQSVAEMLVDWAWLSGPRAIRYAQAIVHTVPDGRVGPLTLKGPSAPLPAYRAARPEPTALCQRLAPAGERPEV